MDAASKDPRLQPRRDGGVLMQPMVRRFACPQHFDTGTELECLLCMSMPTVSGKSADDYEVSFDGARACVQTEMLARWAVTRWREIQSLNAFPATTTAECRHCGGTGVVEDDASQWRLPEPPKRRLDE